MLSRQLVRVCTFTGQSREDRLISVGGHHQLGAEISSGKLGSSQEAGKSALKRGGAVSAVGRLARAFLEEVCQDHLLAGRAWPHDGLYIFGAGTAQRELLKRGHDIRVLSDKVSVAEMKWGHEQRWRAWLAL